MKIWDPRMETKALRTIKFHDHLIPNLCDLYEDDSIFDKFTCAWSGKLPGKVTLILSRGLSSCCDWIVQWDVLCL